MSILLISYDILRMSLIHYDGGEKKKGEKTIVSFHDTSVREFSVDWWKFGKTSSIQWRTDLDDVDEKVVIYIQEMTTPTIYNICITNWKKSNSNSKHCDEDSSMMENQTILLLSSYV